MKLTSMNSEYLGVDKEKQDMASVCAEEENARSVGAGRTNACACKCGVTGWGCDLLQSKPNSKLICFTSLSIV